MKYCRHCGGEMHDQAVFCVRCGCAVDPIKHTAQTATDVVGVISKRIETNGIIWIVISIIQMIIGLSGIWLPLIVGVLNLISAIQDLMYSQALQKNPVGIVAKVRPLASPIITLAYNLLIGGVIGVAGSIYYFVAVRGYVLENEKSFLEIENQRKREERV